MVSVDQYLAMTKRQRRAIARRMLHGNKKDIKEYAKLTNALKVRVNKNLRELTRKKFDYGIQFTDVVKYGLTHGAKKKRLSSARELDFDIQQMNWQNEVAVKFLNSGWRDVEHAREVESKRIEALKDYGVIPENFSRDNVKDRRKNVEFLRWLGSEESSAMIDVYGRSEMLVEIAWDVYQERGRAGLRDLSIAYLEYLSGKVGFDKAMTRSGVTIDKYLLKR